MKRLRIALIGCGRISYKHIEGIVNNREIAELVAVCDLVPERMEQRATQYGELMLKEQEGDIQKGPLEEIAAARETVAQYRDYQEMLQKETIDIVTIATESGYHARIALDCLEAGTHVLVEKPMALSLEDADKMIALAREKNKKNLCLPSKSV